MKNNKLKRLLSKLISLFKRKTVRPESDALHISPNAYDDVIDYYRSIGCHIGKFVRLIGSLDTTNPHLIKIGDYSVIGSCSKLLTHCPIKGARKCEIGNFVYIGYGAIVLPGVSIGDFAIIGAGSVVVGDIPNESIYAGNPAKLLRKITDEEKMNIQEMLLDFRIFGKDIPMVTN